MCEGMVSKAMQNKREAEYRAEDDHRTLQRAAEVQRDPTRMKGAAAHHRKKLEEMQTVGRQLKVAPDAMPMRSKRMPKLGRSGRVMPTGR